MPTQLPTRARTPLIVDQSSLTNAVAGVVLENLRDVFSRVTITTAPLTVQLTAPSIPTPEFSFSPRITGPTVNVTPEVTAILSATALTAEIAGLRSDIRALIAVYSAPMVRTVTYDSDGRISSMTERRA